MNEYSNKISLYYKAQFWTYARRRAYHLLVLILPFLSLFLNPFVTQAALIDRGNNLIYDTDLNITYYDHTYTAANWGDANNWAQGLVHAGYSDWRLPNGPITPVFGASNSCSPKPYVGADPSHIDRGWHKASSELGHLFYEELNGVGMYAQTPPWPNDACDFSVQNPVWGLVDGWAPFQHLDFFGHGTYWTQTAFGSHHWSFSLYHGGQGTTVNGAPEHFAIAVRDGDVATACVTPPSGMVSWWDGDEVSGTTAFDFWGSNDGTLVNGATTAPGKVGQAFSFDGTNDFVEVPDTAELNFGTGSFSVDAWISTNSSTVQRLVNKFSNDAAYGPGWILDINTDTQAGQATNWIRFRMSDGSINFEIAAVAPSPININDGAYHHIAVTANRALGSGIVNLFVDGAYIATGTLPAGFGSINNTASLGIGFIPANPSPGSPRYFTGSIDEVEIFDRALTQPEIQAIVDAQQAGKCKIPPNEPPVANAGADQSIFLTQTALLDGSLSSDPEGVTPLGFQWVIDSAPVGSTAVLSCTTCESPSLTPDIATPPAYIMSLVVNDGTLDSAAATVSVTATQNLPPVATAAGSPLTGLLPLAVSFTAGASSDPETGPLTYNWDFGDPASGVDNTSSLMEPNHTYNAAGTYTAVVTVTDDFNQTDQAAVEITVEAPNLPPTVAPTAIPSSGAAPLDVQFTANAADVNPDDILSYSWDFGDAGSSVAANPLHSYAVAGTYTATVTVSDGVNPPVVSSSLVISVDSPLTINVTESKVDYGKKGKVKGKISLKADFTYPGTPAPSDVIKVVFDGITLLEAPFSSFEEESDDPGEYEYESKNVHGKIDFTKMRIKVSRHKMLLTGLDVSNGIDVVVYFGAHSATDHFTPKVKVKKHHDHKDHDSDDEKEMSHKKSHDKD